MLSKFATRKLNLSSSLLLRGRVLEVHVKRKVNFPSIAPNFPGERFDASLEPVVTPKFEAMLAY